MVRTERDVIVIGAGPAGSICAAYMAKAGIDVLLLDKEIFPRDKVCGDILQEGIVAHVDALGAFDELDRTGTCIRSLRLVSSNGDIAHLPFECYCTPRYRFDELMVKTAVKHGAEFRQGCRVVDMIVEKGTVCGVRVKWRGEETELRCRVVIGADGAYSQTAGLLGVMKERPCGMLFGQRAYFRGVKLDRSFSRGQYNTYGVFSFDAGLKPGYFWAVPCGAKGAADGFCNVGMIVRDRELIKPDDFQLRFNKWKTGTGEIARMFADAQQVSPWKAGKLCDTDQQIRNIGTGFIIIGDAGAQMLPLYNDGLSAAANSAKAAAAAAIEAIDSDDVSGGLLTSAFDNAAGGFRITADEAKERRLMQESMYDQTTMNNVIARISGDPVYRGRVAKKII